jgi:hypothetical protein
MKYHSKTPEEWEKEDKEKMKKDKFSRIYKRRQKINNILIILISSITIIIILLSKYYFPRYKFDNSVLINDISVSLMTSDKYVYPNPLDINISMFNTTEKIKKIKITDFKFYIYKLTDNSSTTFYKFEYPKIINYNLNPLETKKIFDLNTVNPMSKIPNGIYVIQTEFKFNDKNIKLKKEITYAHTIIYNAYFEKNFYKSNEYPKLYIEAKNYSEEPKNINFMGKVQIYSSKGKLIKEIPVNFGYVTLKPLEKVSYTLNIPPINPGTYDVYFVKKEKNEAVYIQLPITKTIEKKLKNVSLSIDTYLFYPVNEIFHGTFYINNLDFKKERFIEIEGYNIRLINLENNTVVFNFENNDKRRIYINKGGKSVINIITDDPPIKLSIPGNYKLVFEVKSNENAIEKTLDLYVGISK